MQNSYSFQKSTVAPKSSGNAVFNGKITEALPNTMFKVELEDRRIVTGIPSGKMRRGFMRMLPGVEVKIEMTPYDDQRGRIIARNTR